MFLNVIKRDYTRAKPFLKESSPQTVALRAVVRYVSYSFLISFRGNENEEKILTRWPNQDAFPTSSFPRKNTSRCHSGFGPPPGGYSLTWPIRGCAAGQGMVFGLSVLNRVCDFVRVCPNYKQCIACPKQGNKIELVVLNRVCNFRSFFCPKQGQVFKPSAAHL